MGTLTKQQQSEREEAIAELRELVKPGDTIRTILRHVARSGMSRRISLVISDGEDVRDITWLAAKAMGDPVKQRGQYVQDAGLYVGGCGMDMGFHVVYSLSHTLYPTYACIGDRCPSNDHSNGDRDHSPHHHNSGGYAISQRRL